ncbi:MAG: DNA-binding protein [Segetibacter sp.]|nr:DNA-binding protein [Segetibacter sp.]
MLDVDLADMYQVETKQLKRQVRKNIDRFPPDFMFELTMEENQKLRSQFGTLEQGQFSKYLPLHLLNKAYQCYQEYSKVM